MKLTTINLHSYAQDYYDKKLNIFADYILSEKPDIIAMQEVNQHKTSPYSPNVNNTIATDGNFLLREDNYGLKALEILKNKNCCYHYLWLGIKEAYGKFEEGIGFLLKTEPLRFQNILLSKTDSKDNWKKRMALGAYWEGIWIYNLHTGRWDDKEEPFIHQWNNLTNSVYKDKKMILMGDFNAPSDVPNESYELMLSDKWEDTYEKAKYKDDGFTVTEKIDGWKDVESSFKRIDYIFTNYNCNVMSSKTIFNGKEQGIISDHYGVEVIMEG